MMGFVITVVFVAVWLLLGRVLFSTSDWGVHRRRDCGGVVHGPYLPPVYLSDRPIIPGEFEGYDLEQLKAFTEWCERR